MYDSIAEIKAANAEAGRRWFERGAMEFFGSEISPAIYRGKYFITSEMFPDSAGYHTRKRYTIREADSNGHIHTVGEFGEYETLAEAKRAASSL